ncbi:hypothetical protein FOL47_010688 [Perkinsus chesapeaki]|uniref:Uncharacterized protein n=1 Tax=Perkinsus chesapeaki TaxID=330153 RepID=A0A7J6MPU7_PERCH|nr:hypothetical protein FOL47_010688 [Perkinsus chesapeaki]
MLLPSHVEALRCMMVERLWKDSMSIGPLPELMVDIMAFTPKPTLTLDCPMEEIVLNIDRKPDFIFNTGNVIYGVFKNEKSILLQSISPPGEEATLAETLNWRGTFYYDPGTSRLFVLHDRGGPSLLDYDVTSGMAHKTTRLSAVPSTPHWPDELLVIGGHVFLVRKWSKAQSGTFHVEVLHVDPSGHVHVAWRAPRQAQLTSLHSVAEAPLTVNIMYRTGDTYHSIRIVMIRDASPTVFESRHQNNISADLLLPGPNIHVITSGTSRFLVDDMLNRLSKDFTLLEGLTYIDSFRSNGVFYFLVLREEYGYEHSPTTVYRLLCLYPSFR